MCRLTYISSGHDVTCVCVCLSLLFRLSRVSPHLHLPLVQENPAYLQLVVRAESLDQILVLSEHPLPGGNIRIRSAGRVRRD